MTIKYIYFNILFLFGTIVLLLSKNDVEISQLSLLPFVLRVLRLQLLYFLVHLQSF